MHRAGRAWAEAGPGLRVLEMLRSVGAAVCTLPSPCQAVWGTLGMLLVPPKLRGEYLRAPRNTGDGLGAPGTEVWGSCDTLWVSSWQFEGL